MRPLRLALLLLLAAALASAGVFFEVRRRLISFRDTPFGTESEKVVEIPAGSVPRQVIRLLAPRRRRRRDARLAVRAMDEARPAHDEGGRVRLRRALAPRRGAGAHLPRRREEVPVHRPRGASDGGDRCHRRGGRPRARERARPAHARPRVRPGARSALLEPGGLPLSGHLYGPQGPEPARRPLLHGGPLPRGVPEGRGRPSTVRHAGREGRRHARLHRGEGDGPARGAPSRRLRDAQPAGAPDAAPDGSHGHVRDHASPWRRVVAEHHQGRPARAAPLQHLRRDRSAARPHRQPGSGRPPCRAPPARCNDLFFVSRNDGTHVFCPDLRCHEAAVTRGRSGFVGGALWLRR
jgi:hypothetical protein